MRCLLLICLLFSFSSLAAKGGLSRNSFDIGSTEIDNLSTTADKTVSCAKYQSILSCFKKTASSNWLGFDFFKSSFAFCDTSTGNLVTIGLTKIIADERAILCSQETDLAILPNNPSQAKCRIEEGLYGICHSKEGHSLDSNCLNDERLKTISKMHAGDIVVTSIPKDSSTLRKDYLPALEVYPSETAEGLFCSTLIHEHFHAYQAEKFKNTKYLRIDECENDQVWKKEKNKEVGMWKNILQEYRSSNGVVTNNIKISFEKLKKIRSSYTDKCITAINDQERVEGSALLFELETSVKNKIVTQSYYFKSLETSLNRSLVVQQASENMYPYSSGALLMLLSSKNDPLWRQKIEDGMTPWELFTNTTLKH